MQTLNGTAFKVLLVEDNLAEAELLQELLLEAEKVKVSWTRVKHVSEAIEALHQEDFDVILLGLPLSHGKWLDSIARVQEYTCHSNNFTSPPIVALSAVDDEELALQVINAGAQDYLVKGKVESELLIRSLRNAIERQQMREALRISKEQYRCVVDNLKEVIFQTDTEGNWTFLNLAWTEITGFSMSKSLGTSFLNYIHPNDRKRNLEDFRRLIEGKKDYYRHEIRYLTKLGGFRWIEVRARLTKASDGTISGTTGTLNDITEQKQAQDALRLRESRWRGYFENSLVGIAINTPDERLIEVNDALCDLLGYSRAELTGKNWLHWTHPDDLNAELEQLVRVLAGESDGYVLDKRFIRKDGQVVYTRSSVRCIRREDGACDHLIAVVLDLSDHYHYEQQLKQSEAFLTHIINAIADPIFVKDEQHRWILLNDAFCQWIGKTREELIGKSDYDLFPKAEAEVFWRKDDMVLTTGIGNENEENFTDSQGNLHIISTKKTVFNNTDGSKILVGTIRDITNDKRLLEALQQSEARLNAFFTASPIGLKIVDDQLRFVQINEPLAEINGLRARDHIGKTLGEVLPDFALQLEPLYRRVLATGEPIINLEVSGEVPSLPGVVRHWMTSYFPIPGEEGRPSGVGSVVVEISDRKRAEAALQQQLVREQLVGTMQERIRRSLNLGDVLTTAVEEVRQFLQTDRTIIYRFYPDWSGVVEVESVGSSWTSLLGLDIQDNCFTQTHVPLYQQGRIRAIEDIHNAGLEQCHIDLLSKFEVKANLVVPLLQGENLWGLLIAHHCSGSRVWHSFEIECLRQLSVQLGVAIQQSSLFEQAQAEIAERKQAEAALRQSEAREREKAQQLETALQELKNTQAQLVQNGKMASLGQLVAGVAHEINNPVSFIYCNIPYAHTYACELLNLIKLYQQHYPIPSAEIQDEIEALNLDFLKEDFLKLLESMRTGAERIREIVLSLRTFSRLDEAEMKLADLHAGIDSTLMILQQRLKEQPTRPAIEVVKQFGKLPLVKCYPGQLNQVFMNILTNAIDALEEKLNEDSSFIPQIYIRTKILTNNQVVISITDNGKGIPLETREHLFDPFFTTKPVGQGTGLGLSISYQIIVEKHGGRLKFNSCLEKGTEFIIEIDGQQDRFC